MALTIGRRVFRTIGEECECLFFFLSWYVCILYKRMMYYVLAAYNYRKFVHISLSCFCIFTFNFWRCSPFFFILPPWPSSGVLYVYLSCILPRYIPRFSNKDIIFQPMEFVIYYWISGLGVNDTKHRENKKQIDVNELNGTITVFIFRS